MFPSTPERFFSPSSTSHTFLSKPVDWNPIRCGGHASLDDDLQQHIHRLPKLLRGAAEQPQTQPVRLSIPDYTREEALSYIGRLGVGTDRATFLHVDIAGCWLAAEAVSRGIATPAFFLSTAPLLRPLDLHRAAGWSNLPSLKDNAPLLQDMELATRLNPRRLSRYLAHR